MIYPEWVGGENNGIYPKWLNDFTITATPVTVRKRTSGQGPGGGPVGATHIDLSPIRGKGLSRDDEDVLEFAILFVLDRSD